MRGLKADRTASVAIRGHAFILNLRRSHYELGTEARHRHLRVAAAFAELAETIRRERSIAVTSNAPDDWTMQQWLAFRP